MDQDQFQPTARELLERHIAETNQPKQTIPEIDREPEPTRPESPPSERYASARGDFVSQTRAALQNDAMINREYREHERDTQKDLDQHIEQAPGKAAPEQTDRISAREALQQHLEGAKSEVADRKLNPLSRDRAHEQEYER